MVSIASLWLPILLSGVIVFIASSLLHMLLNYHRADYAKLPNEDAVLAAVSSVPGGDYMAPYSEGRDSMKDPAFREKVSKGMIVLTVMRSGMMDSFKRALMWWFMYSLVVSVFAAYITGRALGPGATYGQVFRFVATTAFIGYSLALWQRTIWFGMKVGTAIRGSIDGLIYGMLSAGVFGWLWPR
jgi:hypothetical protein